MYEMNGYVYLSVCVCMNSLIFIFLILFIQLLCELLAFINIQKDLAFENELVPEWGLEMDLSSARKITVSEN